VRWKAFWTDERLRTVMSLMEKKKAAQHFLSQVGETSNVELAGKWYSAVYSGVCKGVNRYRNRNLSHCGCCSSL